MTRKQIKERATERPVREARLIRTWTVSDAGKMGVLALNGVRPALGERVEVIELDPLLDLLEWALVDGPIDRDIADAVERLKDVLVIYGRLK